MAQATDGADSGDSLAARVARLADQVAANLPKLPQLSPERADAARTSLDNKLESWLGIEDASTRAAVVRLVYGDYGTSLPAEYFPGGAPSPQVIRDVLNTALAQTGEGGSGDQGGTLNSGRRDP